MDLVNVPANVEVRIALPFPEIIAIAVLGGGCEPQSWEAGGIGGQGWHRSKERW